MLITAAVLVKCHGCRVERPGEAITETEKSIPASLSPSRHFYSRGSLHNVTNFKSSFFYLRAPYQQSAKFFGVTKNRPILRLHFSHSDPRTRRNLRDNSAAHMAKCVECFLVISGVARRKVDISVDKREGAKCQEINFKIVFRFEFSFSRR